MSSHLKYQLRHADTETQLLISKIPLLFSVVAFIGGFILNSYVYNGKIEVNNQRLELLRVQVDDIQKQCDQVISGTVKGTTTIKK